MRRCLYYLREEGGVLERRSEGRWTSSGQPHPPAWTINSNSVYAMIARGLLAGTKTKKTGYARPYYTEAELVLRGPTFEKLIDAEQ